jgi:hypothetical protein
MTIPPNPFILKNYTVYESPIDKCANITNTSTIVDISTNVQVYNGYTASQKMNIMELEKYLSDEINRFLSKVRIARTCDNYSVYGKNPPAICSSTFNNYSASYSAQGTQFGIGDAILDKLSYTESYIKSQQTTNDKKELCQRIRDLQKMITDFQNILNNITTNYKKEDYPDQYNNIMAKYKQNIAMRAILDEKLDNIYSTESSYGNSKRFLDSTIYTSVLWTILATTLVFYIFKKM